MPLKDAIAHRPSERVLHSDGFFGGEFLGQRRFAFKRADNIVKQIAKLAVIRQANLVALICVVLFSISKETASLVLMGVE